jgi:oxygen-independent coproporphyrinogen-3 oxidase
MKAPPLALYAHFPWCVQKCPYCDFNSHSLRDELPEQLYIETLKRDFDAQAAGVAGRTLTSIFFGGGTPSLFSPAAIGALVEHLRAGLGFVPDIEITLEANPGTIERGRFAEYRAAGVSRVSLGAQSFDERQLKTLGRIHSADETRRAAEELHAAGLSNFNLDLMYALPEQSADDAEADLRAALALHPAHLSQYHLTIEPGTLFAAAPPSQPADDIVDDMLSRSLHVLGAAGFAATGYWYGRMKVAEEVAAAEARVQASIGELHKATTVPPPEGAGAAAEAVAQEKASADNAAAVAAAVDPAVRMIDDLIAERTAPCSVA